MLNDWLAWLAANDVEMWTVASLLIAVGGALLGYAIARAQSREELINYQLGEVHARGRIEHLEADNSKLAYRAAIAESRWERISATAEAHLVTEEEKRTGRRIIQAFDPPKDTDWSQNPMRLGTPPKENSNAEDGKARRAAGLDPIQHHGGSPQEPAVSQRPAGQQGPVQSPAAPVRPTEPAPSDRLQE
jgi:hypothetical protein